MQRILLTIFCLILGISLAVPGLAQNDSLALTITPPLIRNNVSPGQLWKSAIKVVNNNDKEIIVFARVVDFKGGTEDGTVQFIPEEELAGQKEHLLSEWLVLPEEGIKIAPFQSGDIEFIVAVPETAESGGHYAAVLIGTAPPAEEFSGATIKVASLLGSLLMLNVGGEVVEQGQIREFSSNKNIYGKAKVDFTVRFQNQGNVHIQPQGEIRITDMRGNQKGQININHRTEFGNVLPGDIRRWEFTWEDDIGILDMGRYQADLILGYGEKARETVNQSLYFWIILFKPLLTILGLIIIFIGSIVIFVRRSVRKAIKETRNLANLVSPKASSSKKKVIVVPKENGNNHEIVNLKNPRQNKKAKIAAPKKSRSGFKMIFLFIIVVALGVGVYGYLKTQFQPVEFDPEFIVSDNYETSLDDGLLTDEAGEEEQLATTTAEELGTSTLEMISTSTPVELATSTEE